MYNIRRFQLIKKELIQSQEIAEVHCGDFHSLVLTKDGKVLQWGGSSSEHMSKQPALLYAVEKQLDPTARSQANSKGDKRAHIASWGGENQEFANIVANQDLVMPLRQRTIVQVSCGHYHTLALERNTGVLWAWGQSYIQAGQFNKGQCAHANSNE